MRILMKAMLAVTLLTAVICGKQDSAKEKVMPPNIVLHQAAAQGNLEAVRHHIKAGSDLNQKDMLGSTPLITAAAFGKTDAAKALIEAGADLNSTNNQGATALHTAAFFCYPEIVKALLENGADISLKDNTGVTALEAVEGPFESVKGIYLRLSVVLGPLGLEMDFDRIRKTRPKIAEMLR